MFGPLNEALEEFQKKWRAFIGARGDSVFFESLHPTGAAWKTEDLAEFDHLFEQLRAVSSQVHIAWVNERWLATFVLRKPEQMHWGVPLIKLMQRRPGSSDCTGLDHVDFFSPDAAETEAVLAKETDVQWTHENNGEHCEWISIWFAETEAKIRANTTLDVCIAEMQAANKVIVSA